MLRLHVVQAAFGDCLLLEYGASSRRHILIDGGPPETFESHLRPVLEEVAQARAVLDLVVLSHVDNDHVIGLLDYFAELQVLGNELPVPAGLWHNSFTKTIDTDRSLQPRLASLITPSRATVMAESGMAVQGIEEGSKLRNLALVLQVPINKGFADDLITVDNSPTPLSFDDLELTIVGPTHANLEELKAKWQSWLDTHEDGILSNNPAVMANSDRSVPNLSSIMFLAKAAGRTMLFTGDGRSDHLLDGLRAQGLLDANDKLHVDVLKLAHHGSDRNVTKSFFRKVTADVYVASANGRDDNPDLATLIWLVEAAKEQGRIVEIVATNLTPSLEKLLEEYPSDEYGYTLRTMPVGDHSITV